MQSTSIAAIAGGAPTPSSGPRRQAGALSLAVGTILVSEWGWEQTNVDFYQVVRVTPRTIVIRGIQFRVAEDLPYFAQDKVTAMRDAFDTDEFRRKVDKNGYVAITRWRFARAWDVQPVLRTRYA